jgi:hypothetical protein
MIIEDEQGAQDSKVISFNIFVVKEPIPEETKVEVRKPKIRENKTHCQSVKEK